ncbi:type II secretion system F family protein [Mycobacterium sp. DL592]|uniref:type II secretion system F family protein n=1 Tax=Mycobacterium sp. DL592 TaxID=2675524 RepID=UPI001AAF8F0F|nr:type II secretion system F family protein [Mycobacterium sp. DL592]
MITAALLLAASLLTGAGPALVRYRSGILVERRRRVRPADRGRDPLAAASALDVLAVCLAAGMSVPAAAVATAPSAPAELGAVLRRAADLLALGAGADVAWSLPQGSSDGVCDSLARLARRSAASGSALAQGVAELAEQSRQDATHAAAATAERASVLIAGPLGLCFLPAFICLGIVPVVAGLAGDVFSTGIL